MIAEKQSKSNIGVGVGFVIAVLGRVLVTSGASAHNQGQVSLGQLIGFVGAVIFIWGCVNYAQAKGYSPWMGALGLLSCIGLLILVILPDKTKDGGMGGPGGYGGYNPNQPPGVWPPPPNSAPPPTFGQQPPTFGQPPLPPGGEAPAPRKSLGGDDLK